jgi:hypothetical protein
LAPGERIIFHRVRKLRNNIFNRLCDENPKSTVIGKCSVVYEDQYLHEDEDTFFCRYKYDTNEKIYESIPNEILELLFNIQEEVPKELNAKWEFKQSQESEESEDLNETLNLSDETIISGTDSENLNFTPQESPEKSLSQCSSTIHNSEIEMPMLMDHEDFQNQKEEETVTTMNTSIEKSLSSDSESSISQDKKPMIFEFNLLPPNAKELFESLQDPVSFLEPHYSSKLDAIVAPEPKHSFIKKPRYKNDLPVFNSTFNVPPMTIVPSKFILDYNVTPPNKELLLSTLISQSTPKELIKNNISQISLPTPKPKKKFGFLQNKSLSKEPITILSVEIHGKFILKLITSLYSRILETRPEIR